MTWNRSWNQIAKIFYIKDRHCLSRRLLSFFRVDLHPCGFPLTVSFRGMSTTPEIMCKENNSSYLDIGT